MIFKSILHTALKDGIIAIYLFLRQSHCFPFNVDSFNKALLIPCLLSFI